MIAPATSAQDRKLRALIARWRQAANEATTADAAVTYGECADAVELAIAVEVLVAICEGCGTRIDAITVFREALAAAADPPHQEPR